MGGDRIDQINELLKRELNRILSRTYEPPPGALVTIEDVRTARDLSEAKVFVSVLPPAQAQHVVRQLNSRGQELLEDLNERLTLKSIPKILFLSDKREERADRIHRLLDEERENR